MSGPNVAEGAVGRTIWNEVNSGSPFKKTFKALFGWGESSVKQVWSKTFWVGRSRSYMASPSSIWSAQLDPISTWWNQVAKNQGIITSPSTIQKILKCPNYPLQYTNRGHQTTHRHSSCCSRCLVCWAAIRTQKLGQVQGLTLPPTPFLPCRI